MEPPAAREFEDIRITVPWGHVAGRWYGNRQIRPILAIHGWLDNIGTWERLIPLMPPHIGVLCIELPGHGQSSHLPRGMLYHVIDFVRIIGCIMQEFSWQKVSLMGHSMGCNVCYIFTALFPQKVDLIIAIDSLCPFKRTTAHCIRSIELNIKRMLIEDVYQESTAQQEPPTYTYAKLERLLYENTAHSIAMENCKYVLERNITKSNKNAGEYYFSRDGRLKECVEFRPTHELMLKMVRNIVNIPYLVIKASESNYINEDIMQFLEILRLQNPQLEFHVVQGKHHVHLNKPKDVAALLNPFINQHRALRLDENVACTESDSVESAQPKADPKPSSKL